jgi:hypothetical protein
MGLAKELSKCKLNLVGVQQVKWDRGGTKPVKGIHILLQKGE